MKSPRRRLQDLSGRLAGSRLGLPPLILAGGMALMVSSVGVAEPPSVASAPNDGRGEAAASDDAASAGRRAEEYVRQGNAAGYKGLYDEAIADFSQAIILRPDAPSFQGRGVAYLQKRRYDLAIADFSRAIALMPDGLAAYQSRGVAYDSIGLYDKAIQDYTRVIALKPDDAEVYFNRGAAYEHHRLYQKALSDYRQSLKLDPTLQSSKDGLKRIGAKS